MVAADRLPATWRERAGLLEMHGAIEAASTLRTVATELEQALRATANEQLTLEQAHRESGYSSRRLRELIAEGAIPNAGRKGAPRIKRMDLPRKARVGSDGFDPAMEARSIVGGHR